MFDACSPNCYQMLGIVSATVYLSRSFNNAAFPPTEIVRGLKSACLVDYTRLPLSLSLSLSLSLCALSSLSLRLRFHLPLLFAFSFFCPSLFPTLHASSFVFSSCLACFSLPINVSLSLSLFLSPVSALSRPVSGSAGMKRPSPAMFHFDFPKFPARCQTFVDWIGLFTVAHRSFLSFFFSICFSSPSRKLRSVSPDGRFDGVHLLGNVRPTGGDVTENIVAFYTISSR